MRRGSGPVMVVRSGRFRACTGGVKPATLGRAGSDTVTGCRDGGFALLEVMVCAVVLTVAIAMFLATIAQNVQLEEMNSETNIALHAAGQVVEEVHSLTYAEVGYGAISQTFEASGLGNDNRTIRLMNSAGSTQVGQVTITEDAEGMTRTVHVRVLWRSVTGSDRSMALMTEVTDY